MGGWTWLAVNIAEMFEQGNWMFLRIQKFEFSMRCFSKSKFLNPWSHAALNWEESKRQIKLASGNIIISQKTIQSSQPQAACH